MSHPIVHVSVQLLNNEIVRRQSAQNNGELSVELRGRIQTTIRSKIAQNFIHSKLRDETFDAPNQPTENDDSDDEKEFMPAAVPSASRSDVYDWQSFFQNSEECGLTTTAANYSAYYFVIEKALKPPEDGQPRKKARIDDYVMNSLDVNYLKTIKNLLKHCSKLAQLSNLMPLYLQIENCYLFVDSHIQLQIMLSKLTDMEDDELRCLADQVFQTNWVQQNLSDSEKQDLADFYALCYAVDEYLKVFQFDLGKHFSRLFGFAILKLPFDIDRSVGLADDLFINQIQHYKRILELQHDTDSHFGQPNYQYNYKLLSELYRYNVNQNFIDSADEKTKKEYEKQLKQGKLLEDIDYPVTIWESLGVFGFVYLLLNSSQTFLINWKFEEQAYDAIDAIFQRRAAMYNDYQPNDYMNDIAQSKMVLFADLSMKSLYTQLHGINFKNSFPIQRIVPVDCEFAQLAERMKQQFPPLKSDISQEIFKQLKNELKSKTRESNINYKLFLGFALIAKRSLDLIALFWLYEVTKRVRALSFPLVNSLDDEFMNEIINMNVNWHALADAIHNPKTLSNMANTTLFTSQQQLIRRRKEVQMTDSRDNAYFLQWIENQSLPTTYPKKEPDLLFRYEVYQHIVDVQQNEIGPVSELTQQILSILLSKGLQTENEIADIDVNTVKYENRIAFPWTLDWQDSATNPLFSNRLLDLLIAHLSIALYNFNAQHIYFRRESVKLEPLQSQQFGDDDIFSGGVNTRKSLLTAQKLNIDAFNKTRKMWLPQIVQWKSILDNFSNWYDEFAELLNFNSDQRVNYLVKINQQTNIQDIQQTAYYQQAGQKLLSDPLFIQHVYFMRKFAVLIKIMRQQWYSLYKDLKYVWQTFLSEHLLDMTVSNDIPSEQTFITSFADLPKLASFLDQMSVQYDVFKHNYDLFAQAVDRIQTYNAQITTKTDDYDFSVLSTSNVALPSPNQIAVLKNTSNGELEKGIYHPRAQLVFKIDATTADNSHFWNVDDRSNLEYVVLSTFLQDDEAETKYNTIPQISTTLTAIFDNEWKRLSIHYFDGLLEMCRQIVKEQIYAYTDQKNLSIVGTVSQLQTSARQIIKLEQLAIANSQLGNKFTFGQWKNISKLLHSINHALFILKTVLNKELQSRLDQKSPTNTDFMTLIDQAVPTVEMYANQMAIQDLPTNTASKRQRAGKQGIVIKKSTSGTNTVETYKFDKFKKDQPFKNQMDSIDEFFVKHDAPNIASKALDVSQNDLIHNLNLSAATEAVIQPYNINLTDFPPSKAINDGKISFIQKNINQMIQNIKPFGYVNPDIAVTEQLAKESKDQYLVDNHFLQTESKQDQALKQVRKLLNRNEDNQLQPFSRRQLKQLKMIEDTNDNSPLGLFKKLQQAETSAFEHDDVETVSRIAAIKMKYLNDKEEFKREASEYLSTSPHQDDLSGMFNELSVSTTTQKLASIGLGDVISVHDLLDNYDVLDVLEFEDRVLKQIFNIEVGQPMYETMIRELHFALEGNRYSSFLVEHYSSIVHHHEIDHPCPTKEDCLSAKILSQLHAKAKMEQSGYEIFDCFTDNIIKLLTNNFDRATFNKKDILTALEQNRYQQFLIDALEMD